MKKKTMWLVSLATILILGIGGKFYMDNKEEEKDHELEKVERLVSLATKKTFENIQSLEFIENKEKNKQTGSYMFIVSMENQQHEKATFNIIYVKGEKKLENYGVRNETVQKEGVTTNKINILYSNGNGEEL